MNLTVNSEKLFFLHGDQPFFYLADTVWSALTNVREEEWKEYLQYRRWQGFNVLQINVLHQWDASLPYLRFPFRRGSQSGFSAFELDETYFDFAEGLLGMAVSEGFIPALVLLWCNFVPDTWASRRGISPVMPFAVMEKYVEYAVRRFVQFNPIFVISGDTDFGSQRTTEYYLKALEIVKSLAPRALTTMHLQPHAELPEKIIHSPHLDFYMYQSGHLKTEQDFPYLLAEKFLGYDMKRPIVNGEPCYDGHPYGFTKEGRFGAFDVRKAVWQSLLSGASAGVTYGAHGIWCWHRRGADFRGVEFSGEPFEWRFALNFEGAWEASFARFIFERFALFGIQPAMHLLEGVPPEVRLAITENGDKFVLYTPLAQTVPIRLDMRWYSQCFGIDLMRKRFFVPFFRFEGDMSYVEMAPFHGDCLFLGYK